MNLRGSLENHTGSKALLWALLLYLLFTVYGSLVPLDFHPRPFDAAWREFLNTRYFQLDLHSRSDWIANILLFIPLSFLASAVCAGSSRSVLLHGLRWVCVFTVCAALAVGIEFAQMFFPPRTVSMNDIIAELLGTIAGIGAWDVWGNRLLGLWRRIGLGGAGAIRAAFTGYVLVYLALSLFPYDFLVSSADLAWKLHSGNFDIFLVRATCDRLVICAAKLGAECIAIAPLGVLMGLSRTENDRRIYAKALLTGALLGLVIEAAQFLVASGFSQGLSVFTRAAGVAFGVALQRAISREALNAWRPYLRALTALLLVPYLFALMWASGWFSASWGGVEHALTNLEQVHWLPFYYLYYTTETAALLNLVLYTAMYMPVGISYWIWRFTDVRRDGGTAIVPAVVAALIACIMEAGKLFLPEKHADPTDVLIAAFAAAAAYLVASRLVHWSSGVENVPVNVEARRENSRPLTARPHRRGALLAAGLLLAAVGVAVARYPLPGPWLFIALAGYAVVIWRIPSARLPAALALLPLLNLAPWTGRVMLDEFDLLILVTLGVAFCRAVPNPRQGEFAGLFGVLAGLVALSYVVSLCIGLFPLQPWDANAFSNYYSHYNSLRVGKGALWAFCLAWLVNSSMKPGVDIRRLFALGMVAGLAGTIAVIVWERFVFTGLFNFAHDYRVSGPFAALHVGGSSLECYLVAALPFLGFTIMATRRPAVRLAGLLMFSGGIYGVMVTYSRSGFAAVAVIGVLMCVAIVRHGLRRESERMAYAVLGIVLVLGAAVVAVPVLKGSFAKERLAQSEGSLQLRLLYWSNALTMMDNGWRASLFGMGLGRFPETYFWRATVGPRPGTYRYESEKGNVFLRLGSGSPIFIDQVVALKPHSNYVLSLDLRFSSGNHASEFAVSICEKRLLQSFDCEVPRFRLNDAADTWQHYEIAFDSKKVGAGPWYSRRPVTLALHSPGAVVDVDNVHLVGVDGRDLLTNGGFDHGNDRWFFTVDDNWPWHIENFWLHIYFEQGWFGLLSVAMLAAYTLLGAIKRMWRGDLFAGAIVASMAGFLVVGVFNSPNDDPKLMFLFLMLCWLSYRIKHTAATKWRASGAWELDESNRTVSRPQ